ncbi:HK97 gp10 family phage protein [Microbacterium sp. NPDC088619]|uniref:HK97 gp10 family phage protein n=1 Tax=Microbacterium sp. NPDC088619 TaxID=3364196 RepID=UPI0037F3F9CA
MSDDFSELYELARDLSDVPAEANRRIKKAIEYTAVEIKRDWQQGATASGLENYSRSIDYDMKYPGDAIEAEIGPNLSKRQGRFGFVEAGGGGVQSAPQHAGRDALEANESDLDRGLEIAITDAVIDKLGA